MANEWLSQEVLRAKFSFGKFWSSHFELQNPKAAFQEWNPWNKGTWVLLNFCKGKKLVRPLQVSSEKTWKRDSLCWVRGIFIPSKRHHASKNAPDQQYSSKLWVFWSTSVNLLSQNELLHMYTHMKPTREISVEISLKILRRTAEDIAMLRGYFIDYFRWNNFANFAIFTP